jgi:hypothetical protein
LALAELDKEPQHLGGIAELEILLVWAVELVVLHLLRVAQVVQVAVDLTHLLVVLVNLNKEILVELVALEHFLVAAAVVLVVLGLQA